MDKVLAAAQEIKDGAILDEKLAEAIAAYLEEHPIDAGLDEAALAAYLTENGYLTDAALADAVAQALAEAKASGQFDGEPGVDGAPGADGADGVGIQSVMQTTTSTEDGGTNIVTVTKTDGTTSTFQVKNGSKGNDGEPGADGKDGADGQPGTSGKSAYQYAQEGGYTGTEAEFSAKLAEEMPTTLPNPNPLTFTGAVTGSYDGSAPLSVEIPSGGGSGGSAELKLLAEGTLTEDAASIDVDGFSAECIALAVAPYGSTANSGNVNGLFTFGFSDDSSININTSSTLVNNTASKSWNKYILYATVNGNVLDILGVRDGSIWSTDIDLNIRSNTNGGLIKRVLLPKTVKITSLSIGLASTGVIGANTQFKVVYA